MWKKADKRYGGSVAIMVTGLMAAQLALAGPTSQNDLLNAATQLGREYDANYAEKNATAMANLYATDGVIVAPGGSVVHGRDHLREYYQQRFAHGAKEHHITVEEVHVLGNGGYSVSDFSVVTVDNQGAEHTESGHLVAVYAKEQNQWRLRLVEPSVTPRKGA